MMTGSTLQQKRREEIIDACKKLYETRGFHDITMKDIGLETSMSRPSVYNYFHTKEEIFLALLTREYEKWTESLNRLAGKSDMQNADPAKDISDSLSDRVCLLKISSMNLYEIEENSRIENLTEYKKAFKDSLDAFESCLHKYMPSASSRHIEEIRYAFFPFMYGIYPYVYPTDKQMQAMDHAGIQYEKTTIASLTYNFLKQIL